MSWIGAFALIVGRKANVHVHLELIHELRTTYELYIENNRFYEFISIPCILIWSAKRPLLSLVSN